MRRAGGTRGVHVCSIPLPRTNGLDAQKLPDAVISTARPKASSTSPSTTEVPADLRCRVHVPQFRGRAVSRSRSCVPQSSPTCLPSPCAPTLGPHAPQMWSQSLAPFRCRTWRTAQAQPRRIPHTHTHTHTLISQAGMQCFSTSKSWQITANNYGPPKWVRTECMRHGHTHIARAGQPQKWNHTGCTGLFMAICRQDWHLHQSR